MGGEAIWRVKHYMQLKVLEELDYESLFKVTNAGKWRVCSVALCGATDLLQNV